MFLLFTITDNFLGCRYKYIERSLLSKYELEEQIIKAILTY